MFSVTCYSNILLDHQNLRDRNAAIAAIAFSVKFY